MFTNTEHWGKMNTAANCPNMGVASQAGELVLMPQVRASYGGTTGEPRLVIGREAR
jgi:hypothetical protein